MKASLKIAIPVLIVIVLGVLYISRDINIEKVPVQVQSPKISVPEDFTADAKYTYQGTQISGTKFTIPGSMATGTNLSNDSYISLEQSISSSTCSAGLFFTDTVQSQNIIDNGVTYSFASTTGAGAGNRYEETVYAFPNSNPCLAVRYFVHYSAFENYPKGSIKEFDKKALQEKFDGIRRSVSY